MTIQIANSHPVQDLIPHMSITLFKDANKLELF